MLISVLMSLVLGFYLSLLIFWVILDPTHNLKVMDLHGLVRPAAGAESLHVIGCVDLHRTLLHFAIDAHAVVDIVDLNTQTRFQTGM